MRCRTTLLRLTEYLDGELGALRHWWLARHLRRCASCRERLGELKAADALVHLARGPRDEPGAAGPRLPGRLQVELGIGPVSAPAPPSRRALRWRRVAAAAAGLMLLAAAAFAIQRPGREAGALLALDLENRSRASALLALAEAVEMRIVCLRMELIAEDLDAERRAAIEEELGGLAEQVVAIQADARRYLQARRAVVAADPDAKGR
ncbi:MAG: zf-HC2 domain-containing protein [Planctomycetes bacterium]|nr:zf-HC2 domain-containing protein [Planctomycetota bacterium]